jgi:hypothetical protein
MKRSGYLWIPFFMLILLLPLLTGCSRKALKMPDVLPPIVKQYKHMTLHGTNPGMKDTGIYLSSAQPYTILATGSIYMNSEYPDVKPSDGWPLMSRVGKNIYFRPLSGGVSGTVTRAAHAGNLYLGIRRGSVDRYGEPYHPHYYQYSTGSFSVDIIVWKSDDYVQIADFLEQMKKRDPENRALSDALWQANHYKGIFVAQAKASQEIEETKQELRELKGTQEQEKTALLEEKLAKLTETLAELEETKRQFEEEKKKADLLAKELAEKDEREKELIARIEHGAKTPPVIVIGSPKDASTVEVSTLTLSGVVEDDLGIARIEILLNDKPVETGMARGIAVEREAYPRRLDLRTRVPLAPGQNRIGIRAVDSDGLSAEKIITVHKREIRKNVWAVVIGIDAYPNIRQLGCAVNDARGFYRHLLHHNRIPADNLTLLVNQEATLTAIRSALGTHLKNKAGSEDMVVIYFAGHGATERDAMSPDGDGLEKYLLPYGANPEDLYASALPMREISHIFNRIRSERLIFIVDSCYSGASGGRTVSLTEIRATISDAFLDRVTGGKGRIILTASSANEVSCEKEELRHGVFTYFLLEGLRGKADADQDGQITVDEAYAYVAQKVPQATGQEQHPVRKGSVEGRFVLSVVE